MSNLKITTIAYCANRLSTISLTAKSIKRDLCYEDAGDLTTADGTPFANACEEIIYQANLLEEALREIREDMTNKL